ncbi:MAG: NRDE family protein [Cyclobacteriaceae bacterium]|nr:NRDE family protein [Cyclobacteriaceae bacterium]
MCLIFLAVNQHLVYPLIIAANRDEFYNRQTAPADFWKDYPTIVGGRDLEAQGTWMAMTTSGRISMITNYRDPKNIDPNAPSRGQLVSDFLSSEQNAQEYLKQVEQNGKRYNGYNLIVGNLKSLYYYSNYRKGINLIPNGIHGLSNHLLDTPWPKVLRGKEQFQNILLQQEVKAETLFQLLKNEEKADDELLPETGIGMERERALSSMFIKTNGYGTRCSTVILINHQREVSFTERVYNLQTFEYTDRNYHFQITDHA